MLAKFTNRNLQACIMYRYTAYLSTVHLLFTLFEVNNVWAHSSNQTFYAHSIHDRHFKFSIVEYNVTVTLECDEL
mgnify:CR=1 FL=1